METELILALKGIEEIDDIDSWETALVNAINEYAFHIKLWMAKMTPPSSPAKQNKQDENTSVDWFDSFWKICVDKMKEYKHTIHELSSTIHFNDIEITQLRQENFRLKEVNATFSANMDNLKNYLGKADADNIALRAENEKLLAGLRNLESSVKANELKNEEMTKRIIDEEVEKHQSKIEKLQDIVNQQAEYMKRLHLEVGEYDLLKVMYEQAKKENTVINPLKKEVIKLEETIYELNKDYQDIIGNFSNGTCACVNTLNDTTPKDAHVSDRGKNSTATSRVIYESDDETQNKNQLANRESVSLTPGRNTSHHSKKKSLMDEIIFTKHSDRSCSHQELRFEVKPLSPYHVTKNASTRNLRSIGLPPLSARGNFTRSQVKKTNSEPGDEEGQLNSQRSNSAACDEGGLSKRSREVLASELGSEGETHENKEERGSLVTLEANGLDIDFEKEQILLSWEENDFPRLNSRASYRSRTKRSLQGITDPKERKKSIEFASGQKSKRRFKALSNMYNASMPSIKEKIRRKAETPGVDSSAVSLDGYQSVDNQPKETQNMGVLLRQKLEGLKIRQEFAEKLATRSTSSAQKVQKINLEPFQNMRDYNSAINHRSISAIEEEDTSRLDMSNSRVEQVPLLTHISKGSSDILSVKLSPDAKMDASLSGSKVEHLTIPNGSHLLVGFNKENEKETKDNSLSRSNKNPLSSDRNVKTVERSIQTEHEPIHMATPLSTERREVVEQSIQTEYEPKKEVIEQSIQTENESKKEVTEQSIQTENEPKKKVIEQSIQTKHETKKEVVEQSLQTENEPTVQIEEKKEVLERSIQTENESKKEVMEQSIQTENEPKKKFIEQSIQTEPKVEIEEKKEVVEQSIQTECDPMTVPIPEQRTEVVEQSIQTEHEPKKEAIERSIQTENEPTVQIEERKQVVEQSIQTDCEPMTVPIAEQRGEVVEQAIQTEHELMQIAVHPADQKKEGIERSIQTEYDLMPVSPVDEKKEFIGKSIQTENQPPVQIEKRKQVLEQSIQTEQKLVPLPEERKEIVECMKEDIKKDLEVSSIINPTSDAWPKITKTTQTSQIHEQKEAIIPLTISDAKSRSMLSSVLLSSVPFVAGASVTYLLLRGKLSR